MIALADLKGKNVVEIKAHIANQYCKDTSGWSTNDNANTQFTDSDIQKILAPMKVLVAYESVGDYGCDSSSFFLFQDRDGKLFELHGSHCSCFGFEGQFELQETTKEALLLRIDNGRGAFSAGGYDDWDTDNQREVNQFIKTL